MKRAKLFTVLFILLMGLFVASYAFAETKILKLQWDKNIDDPTYSQTIGYCVYRADNTEMTAKEMLTPTGIPQPAESDLVEYVLEDQPMGTQYYAVTAYDALYRESGLSNVVSWTFGLVPPSPVVEIVITIALP